MANIPKISVNNQDESDQSLNLSAAPLISKKDGQQIADNSQLEEEKGPNGEDSKKKNNKFTPEIESQLREAFNYFDVSGDGNIDASELQMILKAVN